MPAHNDISQCGVLHNIKSDSRRPLFSDVGNHSGHQHTMYEEAGGRAGGREGGGVVISSDADASILPHVIAQPSYSDPNCHSTL